VATFQYTAKSASGQEVAGLIQAENEAAVIRALDDRRLFPIRVQAKESATKGVARRVRPRDVGVMYGQLSDLLRADVPVMRALEILTRSSVNKRLSSLVMKVKEKVGAGQTLADSMAEFPEIFTPLHVAMVRAGERAGFLEEVLANLSTFLERQDELKKKVTGAMIYPALLLSVGIIFISLVLIFLVPMFKTMFVGVEVPAPTMLLFGASDIMITLWPIVVGTMVAAAFGAVGFIKSATGQRLWDRWRLKIPGFGSAIRLIAITRFCRILGMMLKNGVPLLQSLAIAKDATGSVCLSESIAKASENVRAGQTLAEPLRTGGYFPAEVIEMIAVSEEANQLEKTLLEIAETVERRTNRQVDLVVRMIEPLILIGLAGGIGFFAVALIYPIFNMASAMK
jgi:general secretion pathway protein F